MLESRSSVSRERLALSGAFRQVKKVERGGSPSSRNCSSMDSPQSSAIREKARKPAAPICRGECVGFDAVFFKLAGPAMIAHSTPLLDYLSSLVQKWTTRRLLHPSGPPGAPGGEYDAQPSAARCAGWTSRVGSP